MADVNANIGVNIDTSGALANLRALQRQISVFHSSMAKSGAAANAVSADMQQNLINTINKTGKFSAAITNVKTTTESFTTALEKNKLSMGEYFRYAGASTKTFGRNFQNELGVIDKVARERVKTLQTQYIKLGRDASGAMKAISVRPLVLDMNNLATQTAINVQKQQLFNQLLKQGSTNLLNWGKNTQWAGRQLMVGFTIPLTVFGTTAAKTFMDMEKQALRFRRVYGEMFTPVAETNKMVKQIQELAAEFTKYGVAIADTMSLAADVAAMGKMGAELTAQVSQATRLAVLGNVEQAQALETTISVTNAFGTAATDLAKKIDFLNAVENQTVTSIEDLTIAIPKAGPVVKQLGGDVEDLAFFLTAMKEGGINASEGANALKSGLASLINPTEKATQMLQGYGINIKKIVQSNAGDVAGTVVDFSKALDQLDPLSRARAIEQLFGKFQFSRLSTLFQNVINEGTQANRVLELAGSTSEQLARLSAGELGKVEETLTFKFQKAVEDFKLAIAPIGEQFLKFITPIIEFGTKIIKKFNEMDEGVRGFVTNLTVILGGLGPVLLMTIGLAGNFVANLIKGFATFSNIFRKIRGVPTALAGETEYMTQEQLQSLSVSASLEQAHNKLKQAFTSEAQAVDLLTAAYTRSITAQRAFSGQTIARGAQTRTGYASGVVSVPGPKGAGDIIPAMLSPGEAVIPAKMAKQYAPLIQGMIAGNLPGYQSGVFLGMPKSSKGVSKNRQAADEIYQMFLKSSYAKTAPTEYGHQISPTSGHSFPIFGLGGVYQKGDKQVFVKPVMDEKAALAEMRATEIARQAHGLKAPNQRIVVIRDPMDVKRQRRFLALESDLDPTFVNNQPMAVFNEDQYFKQLVASLVRVDKDLSASNVFGDVLADVGPAGVFNRASGLRDYAKDLPSMEEQALINLLGIKGGAKRAFAESTLALMAGLTPDQYHQRMIGEIQSVLPKLKQTIASFGLTNPTEVGLYDDMVRRLEAGLGVNWRRFHEVHSAVKIAKPKQTAPASVPGYADGVVSVPGPKGKGDVVPAMLSPGEAVIPAKNAKKYAPLINAMIAGKIPGYKLGYQEFGMRGASPTEASHLDIMTPKNLIGTLREALDILGNELGDTAVKVKQFENGVDGAFTTIEMTMSELAAMPDATEILLQGVAAPGSTVTETRARNQGFESLGYPGSPTSLRGVIEVADRAEAALRDQTNGAHLWAEEYQKFIAAGQEARMMIEQGGEAQAELNFMLERTTQAYSDGLLGSKQVKDANEADAIASARMLKIKQQYEKELLQGVSSEDALQNAKAKAVQALIVETSQRDKDGNLLLTAGSGGSFGSHEGRSLASGRARGAGPRGEETRIIAAMRYKQTAEMIGDLTEEFAINTANQAFKGIERGLKIASPSGKIEELANNVSAGVDLAKDDAKKAGEAIGMTTVSSAQSGAQQVASSGGTRRIRRASTNPETMAAINLMNASTQANMARQPRRASSPAGRVEGDEFIPLSQSAQGVSATFRQITAEGQGTKRSFGELLSTASTLSFGLTSIAGVASMAGGALGEFAGAVFQISGVLFGLQTVLQIFQTEMVKSRIAMATAAAFGPKIGPKTAAQAATGLGATLSRVGTFMLRLLSPVGLAIAAFGVLAGAVMFLNSLREQEAKRIQAFGDAAFLSTKKLNTLADIFDVTTREANFAAQFTMPDLNNMEINATQAVLNAENFKTDFAPEIAALREADPEQAQAMIESMQLRLETAGFGPEAVKGIITAIMTEAKRTELNLDFLNINAFSEKGITDLENKLTKAGERATKAFEKGYTPPQITPASTGGYAYGQQQNTFAQTRFGVQNTGQAAAGSFSKEAQKDLKILSGEYSVFFENIKVGVENSLAPADVLQKDLDLIISSVRGMGPELGKAILPDIGKNLKIKKYLKDLENFEDQLLLIEMAASGIQIDRRLVKDLREGTKAGANAEEIKKANIARAEFNKLLENGIELRIQENNIAAGNTALEQLKGEISIMQENNDKKKQYAELGLKAAEVNEILGSSVATLALDMAIANNATAATLKVIRQWLKLKMKGEGVSVGASTPEKDNYEDLLTSLMRINDASIKTKGGLQELLRVVRKTGKLSVFQGLEQQLALKNVNDEYVQFLTGLDAESRKTFLKIGKNGKVTFTGIGKAAKKAFEAVTVGNYILEQRKAKRELMDQKTVVDALVKRGWDYAKAWEAAKNLAFTTAFLAAKTAKAQLKVIKAYEEIISLTEQMQSPLEKVESVASKIADLFGRKRTVLEAQFTIDTASSQLAVMKAEDAIASLEYKMDDLNAGIQEIEWQEEEVNKKYEERFKALDKIEEINKDLAEQSKSQLDIADALSKGDISAAARAVQELRQRQSSESVAKQRQALEVAQQKELAALTSSNGKTRAQLESEILKIQKEIFQIEEDRLEPAQQAIDLKQNELDLALFSLDQQQARWDILYTKIQDTLNPLGTYVDLLKEAQNIMNNPGGPATPGAEETGKPFKGTRPGPDHDGKTDGEIWVGPNATWKWNAKTKTWKKISNVGTNDKPATNTGQGNQGQGNQGNEGQGQGQTANEKKAKSLKTELSNNMQALKDLNQSIATMEAKLPKLQQEVDTAKKNFQVGKPGQIDSLKKIYDDALRAFTNTSNSVGTLKNKRTAIGNRNAQINKELRALGFNQGGMVPYKRMGGLIPYKAMGGLFKSINTDTVPAMLTPGEFVIRRQAVDRIGEKTLNSINRGAQISDSVYNYNVSVNVTTDANPQQIANSVMKEIRRIDSQKLRGNRF